jgi:hypothetical protein
VTSTSALSRADRRKIISQKRSAPTPPRVVASTTNDADVASPLSTATGMSPGIPTVNAVAILRNLSKSNASDIDDEEYDDEGNPLATIVEDAINDDAVNPLATVVEDAINRPFRTSRIKNAHAIASWAAPSSTQTPRVTRRDDTSPNKRNSPTKLDANFINK